MAKTREKGKPHHADLKEKLLSSAPGRWFVLDQARKMVMSKTHGNYPAAVVTSTPESLDALTPAMLADWHDKRYAPQNTILAISGDIHADTLIPKLKQWLADWQRSILRQSPIIELGAPEFCVYRDMFAFQSLFNLSG